MTYEELLVAVNDFAAEKPPNTVRLLIHLIATGITDGNNVIRTSSLNLTKELRMSRDTVRMAMLGLTDVMSIEPIPNVGFTFTMPADWFGHQRSLWSAPHVVENKARLTRNQATSRLETRQQVDGKPGNQSPGNQATLPGNQATVDEEPGNSAWKPGNSRLETRQHDTHNQQLTGGRTINQSIDALSGNRSIDAILNRIATVERVENHQQQDAGILRSMLCDYRLQFGQEKLARRPVDDKIVARCLTAGHVEQLGQTLLGMKIDGLRPKEKDAWFVTLFLNKIHGIAPDVTRDYLTSHFERKQPQSADTGLFAQQLVQHASAGVRHF